MMKKGLHYTLEDEKIIEFMKLTPEEVLTWLEEINELTQAALTEKEKKFRKMLIDGNV